MKKNLIYAVILLLGFTACRKTEVESVFYANSETRMADTLNFIRNELKNAPYGWKAGLATGLKGGYGFYFHFNTDQDVAMLSDFSTDAGNVVQQSTYRVMPTIAPSLFFDTYNYISIMHDPRAAAAGGTNGQGLQSDVEFMYRRKKGDTLFFEGKKYGFPFALIKLTQQEQQDFISGGINTYKTNFATAKENNPSLHLNNTNNTKLMVEVDNVAKVAKFTSLNSAGVSTSTRTAPFYFTTSDVSLVNGYYVAYNGKLIKAISYTTNGKMQVVFSNGTSQELETAIIPFYNLSTVFGYNKSFISLVGVDPIPGVTANVHVFDKVRELVLRRSSRPIVEQLYFQFISATQARVLLHWTGLTSSCTATYEYRAEGGKFFIKRVSTNSNWAVRPEVDPINVFFGTGEEREFVLDWVISSDPSVKYPIAAIKSAANPTDMLYGRLGN